RRHPHGAARAVRLGRRAVLGGGRPARHRHRLRHRPDEDRPPARDQAAQRQPVRAVHRRRPGRGDRAAGPGPARGARRHRRRRHRGAGRLPPPQGPRRHRALLLALLRRLPGAGEGPRLRRARRRGRRVGPRRAGHRPVGAAAAVRARPAVRHRGGVVVVAGRLGARRPVARRRGAAGAGGRPGRARRGHRRPHRRAPGEVGGEGLHAGRRQRGGGRRPARRPRPARPRRAGRARRGPGPAPRRPRGRRARRGGQPLNRPTSSGPAGGPTVVAEESAGAPATSLDPRSSEPTATATPWAETERAIATAELYWITTVRADGRPHVTPLTAARTWSSRARPSGSPTRPPWSGSRRRGAGRGTGAGATRCAAAPSATRPARQDDVAATTRVLDRQDGPTILVGRSWGGTVITEAGSTRRWPAWSTSPPSPPTRVRPRPSSTRASGERRSSSSTS